MEVYIKISSAILVSSDPRSQYNIDKATTTTIPPYLKPQLILSSNSPPLCRVSFHSVKDSSSGGGGTGTSSDHDLADREILSSSLPTPPPPPSQVRISDL